MNLSAIIKIKPLKYVQKAGKLHILNALLKNSLTPWKENSFVCFSMEMVSNFAHISFKKKKNMSLNTGKLVY